MVQNKKNYVLDTGNSGRMVVKWSEYRGDWKLYIINMLQNT